MGKRAAEKLKALMEALGPQAVLEMTDIPLPQLLAVVEAATAATSVDERGNLDLFRGHNAITAALAALDEALGG